MWLDVIANKRNISDFNSFGSRKKSHVGRVVVQRIDEYSFFKDEITQPPARPASSPQASPMGPPPTMRTSSISCMVSKINHKYPKPEFGFQSAKNSTFTVASIPKGI
ncbi:MAG: hypothetical protein WDM78_07350 [Puia sp.]